MEKWRNILDDHDVGFLFTIYNLKEIVTFSNLRNFCFLSTFFFLALASKVPCGEVVNKKTDLSLIIWEIEGYYWL